MSDLLEYKSVERFSEYVEFIENLPEGFFLSRGQAGNYSLLPSGLRLDDNGNRKYSKKTLNYFIDEFRVDSHSYLKDSKDIESRCEWMVMAQHYGIPTRILDFTYSHVISLMFAVNNAFESSEEVDSEVWFLNPCKLNLRYNCIGVSP